MTGQSPKNSLIEAVISTLVGIGVNYLVTPFINTSLGINMSNKQMVGSVLLFTIVSLIRSFCIRRLFNKIKN
jgi:hypothetical protein